MSQLIALVFDDEYSADEARAALRRMAGEGLLELQEAAIIAVDREGQKHVRQDVDTVAKTQHVGHIAGLAAAAITGTMPLILAGTLAGRLIGRLRDTGVTNSLIKRVQQELGPGMSALLVYGQSGPGRREKIIERLRN
jgi:uncharacterized membrane protein